MFWLHPNREKRLQRLKMLRDAIFLIILLVAIVFPANYLIWIGLFLLNRLIFYWLEKTGAY